MSVSTQDDTGLRPGITKAFQHPLDDHGVLLAFGPLAGTKHRGDEFSREAFKEKQRQVAVTAVVMVVKGKLLLPMCFILRMVHVQNKHFGNFGITADELIHKNLSKTIEVS